MSTIGVCWANHESRIGEVNLIGKLMNHHSKWQVNMPYTAHGEQEIGANVGEYDVRSQQDIVADVSRYDVCIQR